MIIGGWIGTYRLFERYVSICRIKRKGDMELVNGVTMGVVTMKEDVRLFFRYISGKKERHINISE